MYKWSGEAILSNMVRILLMLENALILQNCPQNIILIY